MTQLIRVFISSTWEDLQPEREAVEKTLHRMQDTTFVGMEYFGSRPETPKEASLIEVDRSSVYIGIFGNRYGSGITEAEYRRARERGIPCLIYLKRFDVPPNDVKHVEQDPVKVVKLQALKQELKARHTLSFFKDANQLATFVAADLHRILSSSQSGVPIAQAFSTDLFKEYCEGVERDFHHWWRLYSPLWAKFKETAFPTIVRPWSQGYPQGPEPPPELIQKMIERQAHLVVLGDGGSGKTTALRRYVLQEAQRVLAQDERTRIPVYVELSGYKGDLLSLIEAAFGSAHIDMTTIKSYLAEGRFTLVFDGLNEAGEKWHDDAIRDLKQIISHYPHNHILIATRTHGYNDDLAIPIVEIQPLDPNGIIDFVYRYFSENAYKAQTLIRQLGIDRPDQWRNAGALVYLAQNPLMLSMLVSIGEVPSNRAWLFTKFLRLWLLEWEEQHGKRGQFRYQDKLNMLSELAFYMLEHRVGTRISRHEAGNFFIQIVGNDGRRMLEELIINGILKEINGDIEWKHQLIQEYLAALKSRETWSTQRIISGLSRITEWQESITLLAGIMRDPSELILKLVKVNRWLAARCLVESGNTNPQVASKVVKSLTHDLHFRRWAIFPHIDTQLESARALGLIASPQSLPELERVVNDPNTYWSVRRIAEDAIRRIESICSFV